MSDILTVDAMRGAEAALIAGGDTVDSLMARAGHGAGEWVYRISAGRPITVLCGPGNNGGDGYVIARHCADRGAAVTVIAPMPPATEAARNAAAKWGGALDTDAAGAVLVDCLFGSGLTRPLVPEHVALLRWLASTHHHRIAIDLPSGIEADSGALINPDLPQYDLTIALGAWKRAHFAMPACAMMGALRLIDIGCAPVPGAAQMLARPRIATPAADAHKYRRGLVAVVGGAMPGAAVLAASAARHGGAGYVRLIVEADPGGVAPDLVVVRDNVSRALADGRAAAVLIGPGLGRDGAGRLRAALDAGVPAVVDADALHLFRPGMTAAVLTPHEGELGALERTFRLDGQGIRADRAAALARASGAVVLAKGPDSAIAAPDGRVVMGPRASSWLSVAGSGDVLAGIVASRLAVVRDPFVAACQALWLHGEAARLAGPAFAASELAEQVRAALGACL